MGMYVNMYFGVMITDDLGYFNTSDTDVIAHFEALGSNHSAPGVQSFRTVDDPCHIVGVWVFGNSYGAMDSADVSEFSAPEQEWLDRYQKAVDSLPAKLQPKVLAMGAPRFHMIAGIN